MADILTTLAAAIINACRKVGAVAVPLNYRLTEDEATYIVDYSDTEIALVDAAYAQLFDPHWKDRRSRVI